MEKYMSNTTEEKLLNVITYIKNTPEYQKLFELKKLIQKDKELLNQINTLKETQRKYSKSNTDKKIQEELTLLKENLEKNILYFEYNKYLQTVNGMLNLLKEELNTYFFNITNILK